jgi:(4S)-4-hydroxy-5-phosphonooxypentane-2,3-dione isomerase
MIVRIVKMSFDPARVDEFLEIFEKSKKQIRAREGNRYLQLLRDVNNPNILFTHSHWERAEDLESYRQSELFESTWAATKALFNGKPEAWSTVMVEELG